MKNILSKLQSEGSKFSLNLEDPCPWSPMGAVTEDAATASSGEGAGPCLAQMV